MRKRDNPWGVYAPNNGTVFLVYSSNDYGLTVILEYEDGYKTLQGHNSVVFVDKGDKVSKGQMIALMGDTGRGIPRPNKHSHLGLIPPGKPLTGLREVCVNPVPWLVRNNCAYPCNTKVSGAFQEWYGAYFHEGIDFSGREENLIKGWEKGLYANKQKFYKY